MASQRRISLSREGICYTAVFLAVLIGAVTRQLNLLMLLGSILAGPLIFSLVYGRLSLRRLSIQRKLPALLHADERLRVDIMLSNLRKRLGIWAVQVDDSVARVGGAVAETAKVSVFFPRIQAGETSRVGYDGRLPLRGRYQFGPLRVSTRFPLGLVRHSYALDNRAELLVHPRLGRMSPGWAEMIREHEAGSQQLARRGLLEADFYGLREWRPGDSRRWIHWRTSARRGAVIVRQFEQRRSQNLAVLVDLWQPRRPTDDDLAHVETAVSFVATFIAEVSRKAGAQLTLDVAAREPLRRNGPVTSMFFREQLDSLALVEAHCEDELPLSLAYALAMIPTLTPTFLISTRPIDWDTLGRAVAERESELAGRKLQGINVASPELAQFFQAQDGDRTGA